MTRKLLFVAAILCAAGAAVAGFLYFVLYWPFRDQFDEAGRSLDEAVPVVHHAQSGVLAIVAVALLVLSLFLACWARMRPPDLGASRHG